MNQPRTHIATLDADSITIRGRDLVSDIIGKRSFVEMTYLLVTGHQCTATQAAILDACLVTLMEHGWNPTSIIARLASYSAPGQAQIGIAAGLLAVGDVFAGTMEGCAQILAAAAASADSREYLQRVVADHRRDRKGLPGFGHPQHKPDDPRTPRLFAFARESGVEGRYIALLEQLSQELDVAAGRHITINATGAIAALLLEIGIAPHVMRSLAVVSRSAGLAGHLAEEAQISSASHIWHLTEHNIPYEEPAGLDQYD